MAGVGNLYKTEVCFLLGLSPWTPVRDVPDPAAAIALSRELLLRNADRPQQSTTGELGRGRQHWVFERGGQRCRRCGTRDPHRGAGRRCLRPHRLLVPALPARPRPHPHTPTRTH